MLSYPCATSREEKLALIHKIKDRFIDLYEADLVGIGVYGSVALESDGPYSDIEMYVVFKEEPVESGYEFVYDQYKIEVNFLSKERLLKKASVVDDMWPIRAGSFIHVLVLFDPEGFFEELQSKALHHTEQEFKQAMRRFMVEEPYETMGKIRNNWLSKNFEYLPLGVKDLIWQTAKLIGLANQIYYRTRATTLTESLKAKSLPQGFQEIVSLVLKGELDDVEHIYFCAEHLWTGINEWFEEQGIQYMNEELPF